MHALLSILMKKKVEGVGTLVGTGISEEHQPSTRDHRFQALQETERR